jgi:hypothetical protein
VTHSSAHPSAPDERAEGRGEATAEAGRRGEVHVVGEGDQVHVGRVQGDDLGEGAPVREARLLLVGADLRIAGEAPLAAPATAHEGHGHTIARVPAGDLRPDLGDDPGELVPRHMRERDVVVPGPRVPIAAAHPRGHHLHENAVGGQIRLGDHAYLGLGTDRIEHHCAHGLILPGSRGSSLQGVTPGACDETDSKHSARRGETHE